MRIRKASLPDIPAVAELWVHTFPGERGHAERMRDLETGGAFGGIESVEIAELDGELAGAMKLYPMAQFTGGARFSLMGLAAVGVAPWARRRGVAGELCRHALRSARDRGDVLSGLYPFRPDFYRRLGWASVGSLHVHRFRTDALVAPAGTAVRLARPGDARAIAECYARVAARSNGLIERGEKAWKQHLEAPATHAFVVRDPDVRGYMLVRYGRGRAPEHRTLHVRELVAEDDAVYEQLLGWIPLQRDHWRVARYDATPDERFWMRLRDPRPPGHRATRRLWDPVARVIRGPMLRILDVRQALERRTEWGATTPVTFDLVVDDPVLGENGARLRVAFDGRRVRAQPAEDAADAPAIIVETDIGTLTQIWFGEIGPAAAARLGFARLTGDAGPLETLFRARSGFRLLDEF